MTPKELEHAEDESCGREDCEKPCGSLTRTITALREAWGVMEDAEGVARLEVWKCSGARQHELLMGLANRLKAGRGG